MEEPENGIGAVDFLGDDEDIHEGTEGTEGTDVTEVRPVCTIPFKKSAYPVISFFRSKRSRIFLAPVPRLSRSAASSSRHLIFPARSAGSPVVMIPFTPSSITSGITP